MRCGKDYFDPLDVNKFHPTLTWLRNTEPDMVSNAFYKIYRADLTVGEQYDELATIPCPSSGTEVSYTDQSITLYDGGNGIGCRWIMKKYAYKVQAVDNEQLSSVLSDKDQISGWLDPCEDEGDMVKNNSTNIPKDYNILNYPNPFNPSTEIRFSLSNYDFVTIKIYNLLGEEVVTLVNHIYKIAGVYSVTFDGSNLASGVYFYKLETGNYTATKKMVLIK